MNKRKIIIVLGPTASGKSAIALDLAKRFKGFLISADSRQVYRNMDIGTNKDKGVWKNKKFLVEGVEEYLIDVVDPDEKFTLEDWRKQTMKILETNPKKLAIIVGGTGLYISSLVENYAMPGTFDPKVRVKLEKQLKKYGINYLLNKIKRIDPDIEKKIDTKNPRRVIRAAEIIFETNRPFIRETGESEFEFLQIGVNRERAELYERINKRVEQMIDSGLVDEVKKLHDQGYKDTLPAMTGIGYRQICQFLRNEISGQEAVRLIQRDTRRYAKRQLTWFKRDKKINWISDYAEAEKLTKHFLEVK